MPNKDENKKIGFESSVPIEKIWSKFENGTLDSKFCIPLGENDKGEDITISLDSASHILAAGGPFPDVTNYKHVVLSTLLRFNKPDDLKLILIDLMEIYFNDYNDIDNRLIFPIASEYDETMNILEWVNREISRRQDILKKNNIRNIETYNNNNLDNIIPKIVILFSDSDCFVDYSGKAWDYEKGWIDQKAWKLVMDILMKSKNVGIHLIMTMENASKKTIPSSLRENIATKIAFRTQKEEDSCAILGHADAEKLTGLNDMIVKCDYFGEELKMQGYYFDEENIKKLVPKN